MPVNGYMGQDSHLADSVKAVRLLLGVDDNRQGRLRLVPRFPAAWTHCAIEGFPALTNEGRGTVAYTLDRDAAHYRMDVRLSAPISLDVRVGPFAERPAQTVLVNGSARPLEPFRSGDSWWGWVRALDGDHCTLEV